MSSGTMNDWMAPLNVFGATMGGGAIPDQSDVMGRIRRLGMSPRQTELNHLYAVYRGQQYETCSSEWDGSQKISRIDREAINSGAYIPPGFYDLGAMLPLRFRKPTAPYPLARVIVDRFTSLLFSEKRHPRVKVEDDDATDDYVSALLEASRFWPIWMQARGLGGAMGSVAVGFSILAGKPHLEIFDPRWATPTFVSRTGNELKRLEVLYQYPREIYDGETGVWREVPFWYRRVIDAERDIVYRSIPVTDEAPVWQVENEVVHGLGEVPVAWVQNTPSQDDADGDSDYHGVLEMLHAIDQLLAQAQIGTIANADPTLVISTDASLPPDLAKGSRAPIQLPSSGKAQYLELQGIGAKAATELADLYRKRVLEACHCVLDDAASDGSAKVRRTATEIERSYAAMIARTDVLREQWAEMGIKPLLRKMLRAIRHVEQGRVGEDGRVVRGVVVIPPHIDRDANGKIVGKRPREIGEGEVIELVWPSYFEPTIDDADVAVKTAAAALAGQLVDQEAAVAYVAPFFHVADPKAMADRIQQAAAKQMALVGGIEAGLPAGETIDGPGGASPFAAEDEPAEDEQPVEGEDVEEAEVEA
ncbi:MAG: hypothetical protein RL199_2321 [Pseudomonadota bacterium]|jgi:hypothetical protein